MSSGGEESDEMCYQCVTSSIMKVDLTLFFFRIEALNKACGDAYKAHYECLDNHNQQYKDCRPAERGLNACAFLKLVIIHRLISSADLLGIDEDCTRDARRTNTVMA